MTDLPTRLRQELSLYRERIAELESRLAAVESLAAKIDGQAQEFWKVEQSWNYRVTAQAERDAHAVAALLDGTVKALRAALAPRSSDSGDGTVEPAAADPRTCEKCRAYGHTQPCLACCEQPAATAAKCEAPGHRYDRASSKCVLCGSHRVNGGPCNPPKAGLDIGARPGSISCWASTVTPGSEARD